MRSFMPVVLATVLLVVPFAASQVPPALPQPTPIYTVSIQNAPAEITGLDAPNATASAPFQVVLVLGNVVCPQAETIPVTIAVAAANAPSFFSVVAEPSVVNFTIDAGPHGSAPVGSAGGGTADSALRASIAGNITANASVAITITASAPAPTVCQGAGSASAATSEPVTVFANMTAPPPPPPEPTPEEDTPFVGLLAVTGVAALVALARRRRA